MSRARNVLQGNYDFMRKIEAENFIADLRLFSTKKGEMVKTPNRSFIFNSKLLSLNNLTISFDDFLNTCVYNSNVN